MSSTNCFFPNMPSFFNKRPDLVLPWWGSVIHPYVADDYKYIPRFQRFSKNEPRTDIDYVDFAGWGGPFWHDEPIPIPRSAWGDEVSGLLRLNFEVIFHLLPDENRGLKSEVLAISFDECESFYVNHRNSVYVNYEKEQAVGV